MKRVPSSSPIKLGSQHFEAHEAMEILTALSQYWRLETFRLLVRYLPYGLSAGEIARLLAVPHNSLSTHLSALEQAGLIVSRREGRSIIYAACKDRALRLGTFLLKDCCRETVGTGDILNTDDVKPFPAKREESLLKKTYNVLVLCTGNSARSILAEAILNREGMGRILAYSAGSRPKKKPNLHALALLKGFGYDIASLRSKSWREFSAPRAPTMDFIITVCDYAAGEPCPHWPGHPLVAHWGIPDPAAVQGTDAEKRAAITDTYRRLSSRITDFVNLDIENLDLASLKQRLVDIGRMEGATEMALKAA
jgi:arsenate reductase